MRVRTARGHVDAEHVIVGTNAYTGAFWPGLRKTFLPSRTPQLVSRPLRDNVAKSILPGGQIMSDTRYLTVGVRMHEDGRLHLGGGNGTAGADTDALYAPLARQARLLYPHLGELEWQYRWSGFMAMTPDRYPRLFELAPRKSALRWAIAAAGSARRPSWGPSWRAGPPARRASTSWPCRPRASSARCPTMRCAGSCVESAVRYYSFRDRVADPGQASA